MRLTAKPCLLPVSLAAALAAAPAAAQTAITPDRGNGFDIGTIVSSAGNETVVTGGTLAGGNLFHSFTRFDLAHGDIAQWVRGEPDAASIANVINRVTGGDPSDIDGTLRVADMPDAAFWFMNPAGILFGPGSSIDVPGATFFSTSQELYFADGAAFRTLTPDGSIFSSASPEAFGFLSGRGDITAFDVDWIVRDLTMTAANIELSGFLETDALSLDAFGVSEAPFGDPAPGEVYLNFGAIETTRLSLQAGYLAMDFFGLFSGIDGFSDTRLHANTIAMFESGISFADTRIAGESGINPANVIDGQFLVMENSIIQAFTDGTVDAPLLQVNFDQMQMNASIVSSQTFGLDQIADDGTIIPAADSGRIEINLQFLDMFNGSEISTDTFGDGDAGALSLNSAALNMEGGSSISARTHSIGDGGSIGVTVESGALYDSSQISSDADFGSTGNAGNIEIAASSNLDLFGQSFITSSAGLGSLGNGGSIEVKAASIGLNGGSEIQSNTFDSGDAGDVTVEADTLYVFGNSFIASQASPESTGNGGNLNVSGKQLFVGAASINTTTFGLGDAGNIVLDFAEVDLGELAVVTSSALSISSAPASAGTVTVQFDQLTMNNAVIASSTNTAGDGGTIALGGRSATLTNGASIGVGTLARSTGDAGSIAIDVDLLSLAEGSVIGSETLAAGKAGTITINASTVELARDARLTSSSFGSGNGGNVNIVADLLDISDASISAATGGVGQGGLIAVSATGIDIASSSAIKATTEGAGMAGSISLTGDNIALRNSEVSTVSVGSGNAGEIRFHAKRIDLFDGAQVTTDSVFGPAGDISLILPPDGRLTLAGEIPGVITTSSGANTGGRITIAEPYLILSDGGSILALGEVSGANVQILSDYFLRSSDRINLLSVNGDLVLDSQFSDPSAGTEAPDIDFLDASSVLSGQCAGARATGQTSRFTSRVIGPYISVVPMPSRPRPAPDRQTTSFSQLAPCG